MNMESMEVLPTAGKTHAGYEPPPGGNDDGNDENSRKKPAVRKRTKTGCLSKCSRPLAPTFSPSTIRILGPLSRS